jgi:predicted metal-dependent enzyme (double-stranded beta helix superfamily)
VSCLRGSRILDDESSPLAELQQQQRRLAIALDEIDDLTAGSDDYENAFTEVNTLVKKVVASHEAVPLRIHQAQHDRYPILIRWIGAAWPARRCSPPAGY